MDFSSAFWSDCSWDPFAFSPHNIMWQRVPQFRLLLSEQGLQQLVLNLLLDGSMWSLTFLCSCCPCPSKIADLLYFLLTASFPGWRDLACFIFSLMEKLFYTSSYPIAFFCTFSVLIYLLSVTISVCINQATNPPQVYPTINTLIVMFYISNFSVLFL